MILTYRNKPEIVWLGGYLRNFCQNFGKKRNFGQNLDFIEFRPKFRVEREFRPNRNQNQKSSFRFRSNRNRNTNLNFGFGFLLSKIRFLCSLIQSPSSNLVEAELSLILQFSSIPKQLAPPTPPTHPFVEVYFSAAE